MVPDIPRDATTATAVRPGVLDTGAARRLSAVDRVAVLPNSALGEFVLSVPAQVSLRVAYPESEIALLAYDWQVPFLEDRPWPVDRVIALPEYPDVHVLDPGRGEDPPQDFFRAMRREAFDLAVQLHGGSGKANAFAARLGARVAIGACEPEAEPLDRWVPYAVHQSKVARHLDVVGLIGAPPVTLDPRVEVTAGDRSAADDVLDGLSDPIVALHPGAKDPRRRWPAPGFARVGDALVAAGASVVIVGTESETALIQAVADRMHLPTRPLPGAVDMGGLAGVLARCRLLVGNDSGPRHLADAVGTATVAVYWFGHLLQADPLTRTRHRVHVSWTSCCPSCGGALDGGDRGRGGGLPCEHRESLVADVPADPVIADALALLRSESR